MQCVNTVAYNPRQGFGVILRPIGIHVEDTKTDASKKTQTFKNNFS